MVIKNKILIEKEPIGQIFTPNYIAEFMVQNLLNFIKNSNKPPQDYKVLEPSVGEGIFLDYLLKFNFSNITAYEMDKNLMDHLINSYSNVDFRLENFLGSDPNEKFDIIIGNPPYLGQNYNSEIFQEYLEKFPFCAKYFVGNMDLFYFFIHMGIEKLKPGGLLTFITTEYWITKSKKTGIKYLKPHLLEECFLLQYIDLSNLNIFKGAKGQKNCIFIIQKKSNQEKIQRTNKNIEVIQVFTAKKHFNNSRSYNERVIKDLNYNENLKYGKKYISALKNNELRKDQSWNLIYPKEVQIFVNKIEDLCRINGKISYLQDYFIIRNGLILIKDSIFILHEGKNLKIKDDNFFISIHGKFVKLTGQEKNRLKKIYKSKSIEKYCFKEEEHIGYLIYFNKDEFKINNLEERNKALENKYPNLSRYIRQFKRELTAILINAKENPNDFYFPRRGSFMRQFNQEKKEFIVDLEPLYDNAEKMFFKFISNKNIFGYSNSSYYATSDTYFLWPKNSVETNNTLFLLAYLNSKLVYFLIKAKNLSIKRSKTKLEQGLPIPNFSNFKNKEKEPIYELVKILSSYLVEKKNKKFIYKTNDFQKSALASKNLFFPKKIGTKEMIINAMKFDDKRYIQRVLDALFFLLFDLNENLINNLLSEYYNS